MKRRLLMAGVGVAAVLALASSGRTVLSNDRDGHDESRDESRIRKGFEVSPVKLTYHPRNRRWVGLGSYIVNAQGACNDCHSCPSYAHGGNPYAGEKTLINSANYLAGGVGFGPFTSANLTPDASGKPYGLSFRDFLQVMHSGHNPSDPPGEIVQVMPWPVYGNMTDHDLRAVYEFLRAIPQATPGSCSGAGEAAP
jgi:hypothetical protein